MDEHIIGVFLRVVGADHEGEMVLIAVVPHLMDDREVIGVRLKVDTDNMVGVTIGIFCPLYCLLSLDFLCDRIGIHFLTEFSVEYPASVLFI